MIGLFIKVKLKNKIILNNQILGYCIFVRIIDRIKSKKLIIKLLVIKFLNGKELRINSQ